MKKVIIDFVEKELIEGWNKKGKEVVKVIDGKKRVKVKKRVKDKKKMDKNKKVEN